jgi:hypothetical protein
VLTPDQKGAIAETAVIYLATKLGIPVWTPVAEGGRVDLILEVDGKLLRVQCKWASRRGGVMVVQCRSCRRTRNGYVRRSYGADEVDFIAAYCADVERCYLLPAEVFAGRPVVQLRLSPPLNGQRLRINWAESFEFTATLGALGAVAQLGERRAGSA